MVSFVQFMLEGEEPPKATLASIKSLSLEAQVSETCLAVWKSFNQAHELVRFVLDRIAKGEDFPRLVDAVRFLDVWTGRAFQFMELVGHELRASSVDTCIHDAALRFAGQAFGAFKIAAFAQANQSDQEGWLQPEEYLKRIRLPDLVLMNDRLAVEKARTLERVCQKVVVDPQQLLPNGVSLMDVALLVNDGDVSAAKKTKKRWHNLREPHLPTSVGADPLHAQAKLYPPSAILEFAKIVEGCSDADFSRHLIALRAKARRPRPSE